MHKVSPFVPSPDFQVAILTLLTYMFYGHKHNHGKTDGYRLLPLFQTPTTNILVSQSCYHSLFFDVC